MCFSIKKTKKTNNNSNKNNCNIADSTRPAGPSVRMHGWPTIIWLKWELIKKSFIASFSEEDFKDDLQDTMKA